MLEHIFRLEKANDINELKESITTDNIRRIYAFVASIFPLETKFSSLMEPNHNKLRAIYIAPIEPDQILRNVVRYSLYSDEIFLLNPLLNPICMAPKYNPLFQPELFKLYTLKTLVALRALAPWIRASIVQLVPDPSDFNYQFRRKTWSDAERRLMSFSASERQELFNDEENYQQYQHDVIRSILAAPEHILEDYLRTELPTHSDETISGLVRYAKTKTEEDMLSLPNIANQLLLKVGGNLELSMFLADAFGAFPYTANKNQWFELQTSIEKTTNTVDTWTPLTKAFQQLDFSFLDSTDVIFAARMKESGRLSGFRNFLKKTWTGLKNSDSWSDETARSFADELKSEQKLAEVEWNKINQDLLKSSGTAVAGLAGTVSTISAGNLVLGVPAGGIFVKSVADLAAILLRKNDFPKTKPASVFMDLERTSKKKSKLK